MSLDRYNSERYLDLTAYEAIKNIEEEMKMEKRKVVFICSPYAGDIDLNTGRARRYGRFAITKKTVPFIPHLLYPQLLDENDLDERNLGISMGIRMLGLCHELWVFGDKISSGMAIEIKKAKSLKIPIRYFTTQCKPRKEV
ncbi:hypothetical protein J2Z35_002705 [Acetoanaerobium pronyense]|uniref:DUF7768 domain-containing protein n=1 Tax=Acetoanaerobium pronyense TaxID=1482736 RepID=A0ABS4KM47_9FIRM|nr:DUF4406 domain-containing protein [Acetoanaerobium pronyense]MBP2028867.1 hypothetical protein [Acetoanaerobium pronyense]